MIVIFVLQVLALNARLKLSKDELRTGAFIVLHRWDDLGSQPQKHCQDLLCDTIGKEPKTKDKIVELLKYRGHRELLAAFQEWELPRFPVNGHRLLELGVPKGPALAKTLAAFRNKWKETGYKLNQEELLEYLDEIKKDL